MTNLNELEATAQDLMEWASHLDGLAENAETDAECFELRAEADASRDEATAIFNRIY